MEPRSYALQVGVRCAIHLIRICTNCFAGAGDIRKLTTDCDERDPESFYATSLFDVFKENIGVNLLQPELKHCSDPRNVSS